ncbi:MAG: prolyl oligopeptidase family serine peptidase [Caulobacteraceae bacterium]
MRRILIAAAALAAASVPAFAQPPAAPAPSPPALTQSADDPFIWLEDAEGPRALDWVRAENARSLAVLENDPRYPVLHAQALRIVDATDRIPTPGFRAGAIYNLWQDAEHPQGLWRRTSLDNYRTAAPAWETVLDLDALSKAEGKTWVWRGAVCRKPDERRCILALSDGGEDAGVLREFDLPSKQFVDGGFSLPRGKQNFAWLDDDTLVLDREWGPGTMTESGYPFVVKTLKRGQSPDQAREIFRGKPVDVTVEMTSLFDGAAGRSAVLLNRGVTFFETEEYLVAADGVKRLPLPLKVTPRGLLGGRLIFTIEQDWTPAAGGRTYPQGALLAADLDALAAGRADDVQTLYAPGPRESIESVGVSRSRVVVSAYENVRGRLLVFAPGPDGTWTRGRVALGDNLSVDLDDVDDASDLAFVETANFLQPTTLSLVDAAALTATPVKTLPPRFDASKDVIEQFEATSKDGTKVPYFVVRPKDLAFDGTAPTLLIQISMTPSYSPTLGKLWLERGGVYVLANIRGGGEFGPAWHEAGLKTHRQRIYDDFAAVGEDLIARRITTPRRLGIEGGSNGGLLMGVEFTQHPELWNAVVIQVPLLDMLRFPKIGAGASWVGEYGSPDIPEERAFLASISPYHNLKAGAR